MTAAFEWIIRKASLDDAATLAVLLRSIGGFKHLASKTEDETRALVARHLQLCLNSQSHSIYVALDDAAHLMAYVSVHWLPYLILRGPEGFISELFVNEAARGNGIGKRLLDAVYQEAQSRGCSRLQLINFRSRESYERGFYNKAGWEERPDGASFVRPVET